jgi:hypothetical protein
MPKYQFTYDYTLSYTVELEATDEDTAWEMFHHGKGLSAPVLIHQEMLDTIEIEELDEEEQENKQ